MGRFLPLVLVLAGGCAHHATPVPSTSAMWHWAQTSTEPGPAASRLAGRYRAERGDRFEFRVVDETTLEMRHAKHTYRLTRTPSGAYRLPGHHGVFFREVDGEMVVLVGYCYDHVVARRVG